MCAQAEFINFQGNSAGHSDDHRQHVARALPSGMPSGRNKSHPGGPDSGITHNIAANACRATRAMTVCSASRTALRRCWGFFVLSALKIEDRRFLVLRNRKIEEPLLSSNKFSPVFCPIFEPIFGAKDQRRRTCRIQKTEHTTGGSGRRGARRGGGAAGRGGAG